MSSSIDKVKAEAWFKNLTGEQQAELIDFLTRNPATQDKVDKLFAKLDNDSNFKGLDLIQRAAQVMGLIELEHELRDTQESLEQNTWYLDLAPLDQSRARTTVEANARITKALRRASEENDDAVTLPTNPWHTVLSP